MIIPSTACRILGFLDKENKITEDITTKVLVKNSDNQVYALSLKSNLEETSDETVKVWLKNKAKKSIKNSEVAYIASELEFLDGFEDELKEHTSSLTDKRAIKRAEKEFKDAYARKILIERKTIKKDAVVSLAVAKPTPDKTKYIKIGSKEYPIYESLCLLFDKDGNPTTTGIYLLSYDASTLPMEVKAAVKDHKPMGFVTEQVDRFLATNNHYLFILKHHIRTMDKTMTDNKKSYPLYIGYSKSKKAKEVLAPIVSTLEYLINIKKTFKQGIEDETILAEYKDNLLKLYTFLQENERAYVFIFISLSIFIDDLLVKDLEGKESFFSKVPDTIVMLNFRNESPEIKKELTKTAYNFLLQIAKGERIGKVNGAYHTALIAPDGESESWGYMQNNLGKFVLSMADTEVLYWILVEKANNLKNG